MESTRENMREDTLAAEALAATRRFLNEQKRLLRSRQMKNSLEAEFQEMFKNCRSSYKSIRENDKDEIMDAYQNHPYSDTALNDTVKNLLNDM